MRKITKLFLISTLCFSMLACFGMISNSIEDVKAGIPEGNTLDTVVDTYSVADLTFNGLTNQTMVNENKDTDVSFTYSETNNNKSLVFKFKYDVVDPTVYEGSPDSNHVRIHFDVSDDKWDSNNALWIRTNGTYLMRYKDSTLSWHGEAALTKGVHIVEFGRVALLSEGNPTGNYYVYYKVDGTEIYSSVTPYDVSKMGNTMFFNFGGKNKNNKMYDANLTYEDAQYISVKDLKANGTYSDTIKDKGENYTYDMSGAPTNKSVVFVANIDYKVAEGSQINIYNKDSANWNNAGYIWFQKNKTYFGINNADGTFKDNKEIGYDELAAGTQHTLEYGRLAVMNGTTFTGKYHVYVKIDGIKIYSIDQAICSDVADGGKVRVSGSEGFDYKDAIVREDSKKITVSNLMQGKGSLGSSITISETKNCTFDNTDHSDNYSVVFKFRYTNVIDGKGNQFHFYNNNDKYDYASTFILNNGTTCHLGKSTLLNSNVGAVDFNFDMVEGTTYDIEFGRIARMYNGVFTGFYDEYLKVNGNLVKTLIQQIPLDVVKGNKLFITGASSNAVIKDDVDMTFETADEIYASDLKHNNNPVTGGVILDNTDSGNHYFSYDATAEHKSFIFRGKFNVVGIDSETYSCQFYMENAWSTPMVWIRGDKTYLQTDDKGYQSVSKFAMGDHNIEVGKLYITSGVNTGNYYVYLKDGGNLIISYITAKDLNKAELFITGKNDNKITDTKPVTTYETADEISISNLKLGGKAVGSSVDLTAHSTYSYTASATNKSVVFKFKYQVINQSSIDCQVHFNDGWLGANGGVIWIKSDKFYIYKNGTDAFGKTSPLTAVGDYEFEIGKLYITGGADTGKYYIYAKVNETIIIDYIIASMPDKANIFMTGTNGDKLIDINYVPTQYETPDEISVSDLLSNGQPFGSELLLNAEQQFTYTATAEHKSVAFKFLYEVKVASGDDDSCQIHLGKVWLDYGAFWLRDDSLFIKKEGDGYVSNTSPFKAKGIYEVELGKLYISAGDDQGKYYTYIKVGGELVTEYVAASIPDNALIFTTGSEGNHMYDIEYMPVELDSSLYVYKWNANKSGIQFTATFGKSFKNVLKISEVGFVVTPVGSTAESIKVAGKLTEVGDNYVVKAAVSAIGAQNITKEYIAKLYYVLPQSIEKQSESISSSLYKELGDLTGVSEANVAVLNELKAQVLDVTIDEDTMEVTGAQKSGTDPLVLTGAKTQYVAFIVNNKVVANDDLIMIGYTTYKVTLGANTISLAKQAKKVTYGGSEHFVELNSGHDEKMTAQNLAPMTTNLGLTTVRFDIYFDNLFTLTSKNELIIDYGYAAKIQGVIDELKQNGGVTEFLAVVWTMLPYGYKTWEGEPWASRTCPVPSSDADNYLLWLQINGEAMRLTAELFPDVMSYETWNEAEIMGGTSCPLCKPDGSDYTVAEKALILTDLMYYYNKSLKSVNSDIVLTTPSICCAQKTNDSFSVTSYNFLKALYDEINDNDAVTGFTTVDKDANNYFQVINVHPYLTLNTTTSNWTTFMNSFTTLAESYGDGGTQIWVTEFGFAQNRETNCQANMLNVLGQVKDVNALTRFYFYKVHDYTDKIDKDRWGLYDYDGTIKEIGTAVKAITNPTV